MGLDACADKGKLTLDFPGCRHLSICWSWGNSSRARSLASFGEELAGRWHLGTMLPVLLVTSQQERLQLVALGLQSGFIS